MHIMFIIIQPCLLCILLSCCVTSGYLLMKYMM